MVRKVFTLLSAVLFGFGAYAQPCTTTEVNNAIKQDFPQTEKYEQQLREFINEAMKSMDLGKARAKGTFGPDDRLHIPVVVHIVHDYGSVDYISDNTVFTLIDQINTVYLKRNGDTSQVIAPFRPYIGNPNIEFHLATKDPKGNPTTGITRRKSYLSLGGDDQAKFDQWDPGSYMNIWVINKIGRGTRVGVVAAYATLPPSAASFPYNDGIIASATPLLSNKTIPHELGHCLNLYHTWGNGNYTTNCEGDDEVDDTPPTTGHYSNGDPWGTSANGSCNSASLYDQSCIFTSASLSKILLDTILDPLSETKTGIGFDYVPLTNLSLESVKIYPSVIGEEFEIVHYQETSPNVFAPLDTFKTKSATLGKNSLGTASLVSVSGHDSTDETSAIIFDVQKPIILDNVKIYPNSVGATYKIAVQRLNGSTVKEVTGLTTTSSGAQTINIGAYLPIANGYKLKMLDNPGLKSDSLYSNPSYSQGVSGVLSFAGNNDLDTTGFGTPTGYKGRYNYFYNWSVRYDAITTTDRKDSTGQTVDLNFTASTTNVKHRLYITKNPGLYHDTLGPTPYVKSINCIINISNETDTSNNRFNFFYELKVKHGYVKNCIDYPDTVNTQNIMDYANCPIMFTHQQVDRMRATLASPVASRNKLVNDTTHVRTGILSGIGGTYGVRIDMKPVPDASVERPLAGLNPERTFFQCGDVNFRFKNRSWRDTVSSLTMNFTNGANIGGSGSSSRTLSTAQGNLDVVQDVKFTQPGWASVTLTATGNNTGDATAELKNLVYVADGNTKIDPTQGFYMEFKKDDASNNMDNWPIFNYYDNNNKWEVLENVGYLDNTCMRYTGYDARIGVERYTGTPKGDFDDFFTPAFDLSNMTTTECRLNFMSSGAFRVTDSRLFKDTLEISYSTDCGVSWQRLTNVTKAAIGNKGVVDIPYGPLWHGDWMLQSYDIPTSARVDKVFFRFRYRPGVDDVTGASARTLPGTGNNFYIDRINISPYKLGVNTLLTDDKKIALAPNPTNGATQLIIKSDSREAAQIQVTDIAGKLVYSTQEQLNGNITTIEIPAKAIQVKGVYMVHVATGNEKYTEKLVAY
ncbi:MAG: T9SS type A sorting domain-containing protein [Chitinophagales bacterium]|nr:T9SS type A sorting domain-containing protein [Chitinophagales bacterium]